MKLFLLVCVDLYLAIGEALWALVPKRLRDSGPYWVVLWFAIWPLPILYGLCSRNPAMDKELVWWNCTRNTGL